MFKRLRYIVEKNRDSDKFGWRVSVFLKDFIWKSYYYPRVFILERYLYLTHRALLKKLIENKKVLIIGSGPSAQELERIPTDVSILTCNKGSRLFVEKNFNREIDLFLCHRSATDDYKDIEDLLPQIRVHIFITDDLNYIRKKEKLNRTYVTLLRDYNNNNYYLKRLIKPCNLKQIKASHLLGTSSGMRLLQYALFFGAKEIYLIGIDLGDVRYFWGKEEGSTKGQHVEIDESFLKIVAKKYKNIYSLSRKNPITKFVTYFQSAL
jgi:uncharacterized Rossmann fold enzyme